MSFPCRGLAGACIHDGSGRAHSVPVRASYRTHRYSGRRSRALTPCPCRTLQGAPLPHHSWRFLLRCTLYYSSLVLVTLSAQPACSNPIAIHPQCKSSSTLCHVSFTPVPSSPQLLTYHSNAINRKHTLRPRAQPVIYHQWLMSCPKRRIVKRQRGNERCQGVKVASLASVLLTSAYQELKSKKYVL